MMFRFLSLAEKETRLCYGVEQLLGQNNDDLTKKDIANAEDGNDAKEQADAHDEKTDRPDEVLQEELDILEATEEREKSAQELRDGVAKEKDDAEKKSSDLDAKDAANSPNAPSMQEQYEKAKQIRREDENASTLADDVTMTSKKTELTEPVPVSVSGASDKPKTQPPTVISQEAQLEAQSTVPAPDAQLESGQEGGVKKE